MLFSMYSSNRLQSLFWYYQPFYLPEFGLVLSTILSTRSLVCSINHLSTKFWFGNINHFINQKFGLVLSIIYPPNFWFGIINHFINQKFGLVLSIIFSTKCLFWYYQPFYKPEVWFGSTTFYLSIFLIFPLIWIKGLEDGPG